MNRWPCFLAAVSVVLAASMSGCGKREIPEGTVVSLIYTSDVRGKLEGCGCKHTGGGITKRSARLAAARENDPEIIYCDAGNFLSGTAEVDSSKGKISVAVYNQLRASVVNVSERELAFGVDEFKARRRESKFDYVSANIRYKGSSVADAFTVKKVKDAQVAFIGLCGSKEIMRADSAKLPEGVTIEDPIVSARKAVNSLRGKADVIVVLSTCGDAVDSALAAALPQITMIVGGRTYRSNAEAPWIIGETRIVRADRDGRSMGRMDMQFGTGNKVKMFVPASMRMEVNDPSDPEMLSLVRQYVPGFVDNPTDGVRINRGVVTNATE